MGNDVGIANSIRLHRLVYADVRCQFGLSAQVTANAIHYVASQYLALHTAKKHPKTPIRFRQNAVVLQGGVRGRDFSFQSKGLSLSTADHNRHRLDFCCHACNLQLNAELNASRHIRPRGILLRQALYQDGSSSTDPEARPNDSDSTSDERTGKLTALAVSR